LPCVAARPQLRRAGFGGRGKPTQRSAAPLHPNTRWVRCRVLTAGECLYTMTRTVPPRRVQVGDKVLMKDLTIPEGVRVKRHKDPMLPVVMISGKARRA